MRIFIQRGEEKETTVKMVLPMACLILLVVACSCLQTTDQAQMKTDASNSEQGITDCLGERRTKRGIGSKVITLGAPMIKGLRARQKLLKGLKPVKKSNSITYYNKNGGVTEMIDDFSALNPTNMQPFIHNGFLVGWKGQVGDRVITYDTGAVSGLRSITLSKTKLNGLNIVDIVAYH